MSWNYRILRRVAGNEYVYSIHSVYYTESGTISAYSMEPAHVAGCSIFEIASDMDKYLSAFSRPILDYTEGNLAEIEDDDPNLLKLYEKMVSNIFKPNRFASIDVINEILNTISKNREHA